MVDARQLERPDIGPVTGKVGVALLVGGGNQVAWWLSLALLTISALGAKRMHFDFLTFETETAITAGTITKVQQEVVLQPGTAKTTHFAHDFAYEIDGHELFGRAFCTQALKQGSTVEVEYVIMAPRNARVTGTTTQRTSGMILVIGAALFFFSFAWTLGRVTGWSNRKSTVHSSLAARPATATWGFLPKLRLNRYGKLTTRGTALLLFAPIVSIALMTLIWVIVDV